MLPNRDPRLPNAILNSPDNFLSILSDLQLRISQLESASSPSIEEITGGRLTIADLILSPAEGILLADPTSLEYTGVFVAGDGLLFSPDTYVLGSVQDGVIKAGFRDDGTLYAEDAEISGTIIIGAGSSAGGWLIDATRIYSLASDIGISLDSSVPVIKVGNTAGDHIVIDGANEWIRSSNFVAGASGFNISSETGDAEFNNLVARGELRTFLLTSSNQMAVSGSILVSKDAGKTATAVASADTTINFGKAMTVGDWVKFQGLDANGANSLEWMLVGSLSSGTTYNVTRDVDGTGANDWADGTPFVVIGQDGDSRIEMIAGASATLQLITQGATWDSYLVQAEMSTVAGAITGGGGAIILNEDGILVPDAGDAFEFSDDTLTYGVISLADSNSGNALKSLKLFSYKKSSNTNQITNGDFETGDFTGWTETDPSSHISISANGEGYGGGYCVRFSNSTYFDSLEQAITPATHGVIVKMRVKTPTFGGQIAINEDLNNQLFPATNGEWRTFQLPVLVSTSTIKLEVISTGGGDVLIDNIEVYPLAGGGAGVDFFSSLEIAGNNTNLTSNYFTIKDTLKNYLLRVDKVSSLIRFNESQQDIDTIFYGVTDTSLLKIDAGLDAIGIGGEAESGYKFKVTGSSKTTVASAYTELGSAPSTPETSDWKIYFKSDGLYYLDDAGAETGPIAVSTSGLPDSLLYGDASDGDIDFDGTNLYDFAEYDSPIYTLTRDVYGDNVIVGDAYLDMNGFCIYARTSFLNESKTGARKIRNDGYPGSSNLGGAGAPSGSRMGGTAGADGRASGTLAGVGLPGTLPETGTLLGGFGGRSGASWASAILRPGFNGGLLADSHISIADGGEYIATQLLKVIEKYVMLNSAVNQIAPGVGGGSGAKSATGTGASSGGGGGGGGIVCVFAKSFTNQGVISANGGIGGSCGGSGSNSGGGGGGGGGVVFIVCDTYSNTGTIEAVGGAGGNSSAGGTTPTKAVANSVGTATLDTTTSPYSATIVPAESGVGGADNTLYLLSIYEQNTISLSGSEVISVEGWGLTWTLVTGVAFGAGPNDGYLSLYYAYGTPDLKALTKDVVVKFNQATGFISARTMLDAVQNAPSTIVQNATNVTAGANQLTVTLPGAFGSANAGAYGVFATKGGSARVPGAGFAEIQEQSVDPDMMSELGYNDTTVNITWTTGVPAAGIAIEIQEIGAMENGQAGEDGSVFVLYNS